MVCSGFIQPFDLQCLLVNTLAGTTIIWGLLSLLFIFLIAGKFKMPNIAVGSVVVLYSVMFYNELSWLTYVSVFGLLLITGITVATMLKRN